VVILLGQEAIAIARTAENPPVARSVSPFPSSLINFVCSEAGSAPIRSMPTAEMNLHAIFCLDCGSPLVGLSPEHPGRVYVKAGILDDQSLFQPTHQSWCQSKVEWSEIDDELPSYPNGNAW